MTDVMENLAELVSGADEPVYVSIAEDIFATLTPGSTWTTEDGVEVMVVPVEATERLWLELAPVSRVEPNMVWDLALSAIRKE